MMSQHSTPTTISPYNGGHLIHKSSDQKVVDLGLWCPTLEQGYLHLTEVYERAHVKILLSERLLVNLESHKAHGKSCR